MPRRIFSGEVVSDSCEKSVVVKVTKRIMHPIYKKFVKRSKNSWHMMKTIVTRWVILLR